MVINVAAMLNKPGSMYQHIGRISMRDIEKADKRPIDTPMAPDWIKDYEEGFAGFNDKPRIEGVDTAPDWLKQIASQPVAPEWINNRAKGLPVEEDKQKILMDEYHGTGKPIDKLDDNYYSTQNYYGQGFYTTDNKSIGEGYTKKGGDKPTLYDVKSKEDSKMFDMEQTLPKEVKEKLTPALGDYSYVLDESKNLREAYDMLRDEMYADGQSADTTQEYFDSIRANLEGEGYRGLKHIGGLRTGKDPHNVKIYWKPSSDVSISQSTPSSGSGEMDKRFQKVGDSVSGISVRKDIPNMGSIGASLDDYTELSGIREVSMSEFSDAPPETTERNKKLAAEIKQSGELNPLIVVLDKDGSYILEGSHRYDAAKILKLKSIPAKVVIDKRNPPKGY